MLGADTLAVTPASAAVAADVRAWTSPAPEVGGWTRSSPMSAARAAAEAPTVKMTAPNKPKGALPSRCRCSIGRPIPLVRSAKTLDDAPQRRPGLPPMADAETFIRDFHTKNQASLERHLTSLRAAIAKESLEVLDFVRLAMKDAIEAAEVAALWFVDCDDLTMLISFAETCGAAAGHHRLLAARLAALGAEPIDPRQGGNSRFFGFLRSLQTPEERASAGEVTLRTFQTGKLALLAELAAAAG